MNETPARADDIRDQHIADLRAALQLAARLLAFSAGREADADPKQAARLMRTADDLTDVLNRTGPLSARSAVDQRMDETQLWRQIEDQGERQPLLTLGEAQAVVQLLRREGSDAADELATRLTRRLPTE
ncbi:hypothetical protein ACH4TQ_27515 [Streptomyces sp. NPDC021218]|uniref:hypothetical protein n=1 Tax=Streptomyces sp. NPDC021218 TaxID=3365119 RepID=UPI0037B08CC4